MMTQRRLQCRRVSTEEQKLNKRFNMRALALVGLGLGCAMGAQAAKIKIVNIDAPGVGFNDPTPVAPVGGNDGTTLGQQRMNVYLNVAKKWAKNLPAGGPDIQIQADWPALSCTSTSATLGSAGAYSVWRDFPNAPYPATWYSAALANTLAGADLDEGTAPEISSHFNVNLGQPGCLDGTPFYLGLDGNAPANTVNFAVVLMHEVGHGLGFQALTNGSNGARISDGTNTYPSQWERMMYDNTAGKTWFEMTALERKASAINPRNLVWTGAKVTAAVPTVLNKGTPELLIKSTENPSIVGTYVVGPASFGPSLATRIKAPVGRVIDQADGVTGLACDPLNAANAALVSGRIALVDRGTCAFTIKVKNAQDAGALGVIVADNTAGGPPAALGGSDETITIPSVRITQADGAALKAVLTGDMRTSDNVKAILHVNKDQYAGADLAGRALLYTPNPYQSGSSVSHWDTIATRNLLMEPAINSDLPVYRVAPPKDLTLPLLQDIGW